MHPVAAVTPPPGTGEVRRIAALADPVVRNLRITECYHRLAVAFSVRTGRCANWCAFATWASRQAGCTIRGEDLLARLERELELGSGLLHPVRALWRALLRRGVFHRGTRLGRAVRAVHTPFDAFERTSLAVARGNLKVFEEIGSVFAAYLEAPQDFEAFLAGLRAGEPPDGQRYLRQAFTRYRRKESEPDPKRRAELILLANLEIGLHEQNRLQPEIREALDAGAATTQDLGARALRALFPGAVRWNTLLRSPLIVLLDRLGRAFARFSSAIVRRVITECLMVLAMPGGRVLELGRHFEDPFPAPFQSIADQELAALLARFEPAAPAVDDCGARDWSDLAQRMHFIAHLFRAWHTQASLFDPPFTPEQVRLLQAGSIPDSPL
jgi:hypothetical protein